MAVRSVTKLTRGLAILWLCTCAACSCDGDERAGAPTNDARAVRTVDVPASEARASTSRLGEEEAAWGLEPERDERAVFDLGDNRLLAHTRLGDSLYIDAGAPGFAKYARFGMKPGWQLGRTRGGQPAANAGTSSNYSAAIDVPLSASEAATYDALLAHVYAPSSGAWTVKVGSRDRSNTIGKLALRRGWQTVMLTIPPDRLVDGENMIAFGPSRESRALGWLRLGRAEELQALADEQAAESEGDDERDALGSPHLALPTGAYDPTTHTFTLTEGAGLVYYIHVPESAHLVAQVAGADSIAGRCQVAVVARAAAAGDGATAATVVEGVLEGARARVPLEALAGRVARVELTAKGCKETRLGAPRITVAGAPERPTHDGPPPRYIILWVMDTLRADRVRPFQPDARPEVPSFERLAANSTVFRQYWVQGNESQTSHASVWTSMYPINHNVRTAGNGGSWRMPASAHKLPKELVEAGFYTVGITANGYVTYYGGYGKDFDVWRNLMREGKAVRNNVPSEQILDLGFEYLEAHYRDGPMFLFLGTIDTHKPWIGRQPWLDRYDPEPYSGVHKEAAWPGDLGIVSGSMTCLRVPKKRDLVRINAIYDSNVSYQDAQVGRLLDKLEEWGIADQTMVILTADHGEELWEVGRCGHGASLRETLVHVPLLIHYPPLFPGGAVAYGAEGVDILPTILDALDRSVFDQAQGRSLVPMAQGTVGYPTPSYASQYEYAHAMRVANWKARVGSTGVPELYDLVADPEEMTDVATLRPIERRFMTDVLSFFLMYRDRWNKRVHGVASNMTEQAACEFARPADPGKDAAGKRAAPADDSDPCAQP